MTEGAPVSYELSLQSLKHLLGEYTDRIKAYSSEVESLQDKIIEAQREGEHRLSSLFEQRLAAHRDYLHELQNPLAELQRRSSQLVEHSNEADLTDKAEIKLRMADLSALIRFAVSLSSVDLRL